MTEDDFTIEQWDALCWARKYREMSAWYRLLRGLCGYSAGRRVKRKMEKTVDEWLEQHPSWQGRGMSMAEVERVLRGEE